MIFACNGQTMGSPPGWRDYFDTPQTCLVTRNTWKTINVSGWGTGLVWKMKPLRSVIAIYQCFLELTHICLARFLLGFLKGRESKSLLIYTYLFFFLLREGIREGVSSVYSLWDFYFNLLYQIPLILKTLIRLWFFFLNTTYNSFF